MVGVTGTARSPFICLLYLPILLATQQGRSAIGIILGLTAGVAYLTASAGLNPGDRWSSAAVAGVALSFPSIAVCSVLLYRRQEERIELLSGRIQELKAQLDISQMMDSASDLEMSLNLILLNAQETAHCTVCAVYLKDPTGVGLDLKASSGLRGVANLVPCLSLSEAVCGDWTLESTGPSRQSGSLYIADSTDNPMAASRLFAVAPSARSFACLPLAAVEGTLGFLYVGYDSPNGLTDQAASRLRNFANRAAFSLQRGVWQQGYQSMAYSDSKTGLDNFRQFEISLAQEITRAERYGHRLSVLLLDIDHFKQFNDTHGHLAGDAVLAQIAVILRNSLRGADKPARYGGEEFVIVCPETGKDEARIVADRIRRSVADTEFTFIPRDVKRGSATISARLTISVGYATFPVDARYTHDLTQKADNALYMAKEAGRNSVRGYEEDSRTLIAL
ncbi:MAG: sensor domain-containing diguanylate cyclase [Capsulimonadaceae bacterium]